jgi:hypothetical protein
MYRESNPNKTANVIMLDPMLKSMIFLFCLDIFLLDFILRLRIILYIHIIHFGLIDYNLDSLNIQSPLKLTKPLPTVVKFDENCVAPCVVSILNIYRVM